MKKAMRKLRQKIADELAVMQAEQVPARDTLPITPRGIQAGNIGAFEVVLKWIDEITGGKMNIDELEAGRELDAMIAKRVMGWNQVYYHGDGLLGLPPETTAIWGENTAPYLLPVLGYSTDIAAAWQIIDKMLTGTTWECYLTHQFDGWGCLFAAPDKPDAYGIGKTAPLAICRAALKLMEGKDSEDHNTPN